MVVANRPAYSLQEKAAGFLSESFGVQPSDSEAPQQEAEAAVISEA